MFLEQMPRTASGKVDRAQLKRMAEPQAASDQLIEERLVANEGFPLNHALQ